MGRAAAHTQSVAEGEEAEVVGFAGMMEFESLTHVVARSSRIALSPLSSPTGQVTIKW